MTISIDTNVISALWNNDDKFNTVAAKILGRIHSQGKLVVSGPVYSELIAGPLKDENVLDDFFADAGIAIEWTLGEEIWREAGRAYRGYVLRRNRSSKQSPRRILADFLIGAHALVRGYTLLTLDGEHYRAAFPTLTIVSR
jgi:predicted nucleic acid-binding protein